MSIQQVLQAVLVVSKKFNLLRVEFSLTHSELSKSVSFLIRFTALSVTTSFKRVSHKSS
jgi:hypothetical protein